MILVLAHSPARGKSHVDPALIGSASGKRFFEVWCPILGLRPSQCVVRNVFVDADGRAWDVQTLSLLARDDWSAIVTLGRKAARVARAFSRCQIVELPHPSGRNRKLNDERALLFLLSSANRQIRSASCAST